MLTVCTGWSPQGWLQYGGRFWESFDRLWPPDVRLIVYGEQPMPLRTVCRRPVDFLPLWSIEGCREFLQRHDTARARGREVAPHWKEGCKASGYNFRFDAWKFCRQGFIPWHAAQVCGTPLLCWLDADVVTLKPVPAGYIERLLPPGRTVAYLGREPKHSEIGFQLYRLPGAMPMLERFRALYDTDEIFNRKEWHSAYAFDIARKETNALGYNLTPGGTGNVWQDSVLRHWMDHLKGKRKGAP